MATLHLTLTKKWFDLILSGEKPEEYREMKPYWHKRLMGGKTYDRIIFRNGYQKNAPQFTIELKGIVTGIGNPEWGAPKEQVYILKLGEIIK